MLRILKNVIRVPVFMVILLFAGIGYTLICFMGWLSGEYRENTPHAS